MVREERERESISPAKLGIAIFYSATTPPSVKGISHIFLSMKTAEQTLQSQVIGDCCSGWRWVTPPVNLTRSVLNWIPPASRKTAFGE
jgi:hypothetical protein